MSTTDKHNKSEDHWQRELSPEEYHVLREKGTEAPFSGEYNSAKDKGMFLCKACGQELFDAETKFDSGSGWPSFYQPVKGGHVELAEDSSHGMDRTEVKCSRCGSHLGHVFEDGPEPTGQRYCINSIALKFKPHGSD